MVRHSVMILLAASACARAPLSDSEMASSEDGAASDPCSSAQMFGTQTHGGLQTCPGIAGAMAVRAVVEIDPAAAQEHDDFGFYSVQVGAALTSGRDVFVPVKRGYVDPFSAGLQTWGVKALRWVGGQLVERWSHDVTWKPTDSLAFGYTNFNEQLFGPALALSATGTPALYAPAIAGQIERIDPITGKTAALINPLAGSPFSGDPNTFVMSSLTTDRAGNVYYTVASLNRNFAQPARGAWLVRVRPDNSTTLVPWSQIATSAVGIPQPTDQCQYSYDQAGRTERPLPPTPNEPTFMFRCGGQRPPVNTSPAVSSDGSKVVVVSSDNNAITTLFLVTLDGATLRPLSAARFQGRVHDGCGVLIPYGDGDFDCRAGTPLGNDPEFNQPETITFAGPIANSPVIAPDGSVLFGGIGDGYDSNRGHLYRFSASGAFLGVFPYAFGATPLVRQHGAEFTLLMDNNTTSDGTDPEGIFRVVRLAPDFTIVSTFEEQNLDVEANDTLDGQGVQDLGGDFYSLSAQGVVRRINAAGQAIDELVIAQSAEQQAAVLSWGRDDTGAPVLYVPFLGNLYAIVGGGQSIAPTRTLVTSIGTPKATGAKLATARVPDLALAAFAAPTTTLTCDDPSTPTKCTDPIKLDSVPSFNPVRWMVGTWDCASNWHANPSLLTGMPPHSASGVYTIVEQGDGTLFGRYEEAPSAFPNQSFSDVLVPTFEPDARGLFPLSYSASGDLFRISANGTANPKTTPGVIQGSTQFLDGRVQYVNNPEMAWSGGDIGTLNTGDRFSRNWRIPVGPGSFTNYHEMSCLRRH